MDYVRDGMKLGLGTGSNAEAFLELLAPRVKAGLKIVGTPTSERTAAKAKSLGIPIDELGALAPLDITFDGADEADGDLNLIKGGGGALLRENRRGVVQAHDRDRRGNEAGAEARALPAAGRGRGVRTPDHRAPHCRRGERLRPSKPDAGAAHQDGATYVTDNGNHIYDCAFGSIDSAAVLAVALSTIPGVVEHGLFVGLASVLILGGAGGVRVIERK